MLNTPQTAVFEEIICRITMLVSIRLALGTRSWTQELENALLDPNACKSEAVQGELAIVIGHKDTFDVIPGSLP